MQSNTRKPTPAPSEQALRAAELILRLARKKTRTAEANAQRFRKKMKAAKKAAKRAKKIARQSRKQLAVAEQAFADAHASLFRPAPKTSSAVVSKKAPARSTPKSAPRAPVVKKVAPKRRIKSRKSTIDVSAEPGAPPADPLHPIAAPSVGVSPLTAPALEPAPGSDGGGSPS